MSASAILSRKIIPLAFECDYISAAHPRLNAINELELAFVNPFLAYFPISDLLKTSSFLVFLGTIK